MTSLVPITPPTDNLYKFIAVAGLAVVIASSAVELANLRDLRSRQWEVEDDVAGVLFEADKLTQSIGSGIVLDTRSRRVRISPEIGRRMAEDSVLRLRVADLRRRIYDIERKSARVQELQRDFDSLWRFTLPYSP